MTTYEKLKQALQGIGIPVFYAYTKERTAPPYIAYSGTGQDVFEADNTHYYRRNTYQIEYYFTKKNEQTETAIEDALLASGFLYTKSEDVPLESEDVYVIYYEI